MIELLKKCIDDYDIEKTIVIGRNIINKNPNNKEAISVFLDFMLELANTLPVLEERREFLNQSKMMISFIEENATLDMEFLEWIMSYSEKALEAEKKINSDEDKKINQIVSDIEMSNNKVLIKIHSLCEDLKNVEDREGFDALMKQFIELDRSIEKNYLTQLDQQQYDELSKICSETISVKLQELEKKDNVDYNQKAVDSFLDAYIDYSNNESKYKSNIGDLLNMLDIKLFGFDSDKLFPETVVYYQYVYSRIFEKLNEEGKLAITHASIIANKK